MLTPGRMIKNKVLHLGSAKMLDSEFLKTKKNAVIGRLIISEVRIPAETALFSPLTPPIARDFIISLETVIGMPDADKVIRTPISDSAI